MATVGVKGLNPIYSQQRHNTYTSRETQTACMMLFVAAADAPAALALVPVLFPVDVSRAPTPCASARLSSSPAPDAVSPF